MDPISRPNHSSTDAIASYGPPEPPIQSPTTSAPAGVGGAGGGTGGTGGLNGSDLPQPTERAKTSSGVRPWPTNREVGACKTAYKNVAETGASALLVGAGVAAANRMFGPAFGAIVLAGAVKVMGDGVAAVACDPPGSASRPAPSPDAPAPSPDAPAGG